MTSQALVEQGRKRPAGVLHVVEQPELHAQSSIGAGRGWAGAAATAAVCTTAPRPKGRVIAGRAAVSGKG